jgi:hypothetical protein
MLSVIVLSVFILDVVVLSAVMLSAIMLSVFILNVVMLSAVMLSVVAPPEMQFLCGNQSSSSFRASKFLGLSRKTFYGCN